MRIKTFEMERWQSVWENRVELNVSESGVLPLTAAELLEDDEVRKRVLETPLAYPPTNGSEELRANIALMYPGAKAANVLAACGCSEANYITTWSMVEPGDEVVFMLPNYMQVGQLAQAFGAEVKPLWLRESLGWAPDLDELRKLVTPKTRLIAVCNPNNPTGAVLEEKLMDGICEVAARAGAWLLADEVYRGAEFSGVTCPTFYGRYERVLCTAGFSKAFGMPGLRVGWVVGPEEMVEKLWSYHDYTSIGPNMLSDRLGAMALEPPLRERILARTRDLVRGNYPAVREWVARMGPRVTHIPPAAGAIAWIGMPGVNTAAVMESARVRHSVLLVCGEQFGMPGYIRVGFGYSRQATQDALARLGGILAAAATA